MANSVGVSGVGGNDKIGGCMKQRPLEAVHMDNGLGRCYGGEEVMALARVGRQRRCTI